MGNNVMKRLNDVVEDLYNNNLSLVCYEHSFDDVVPSATKINEIVLLCREVLFPGFFGDTSLREKTAEHYIGVNVDKLYLLLNSQILAGMYFVHRCNDKIKLEKNRLKAKELSLKFIEHLSTIRELLISDIDAAYYGDPAADDKSEIIYCYPAIRAILNYRIAHCLDSLGIPLLPRIIAEMAHSETGIDIHPKAKIGRSFSIDHGTGVVIGSTCIIGNNVKLYQGVTLGAKSFKLDPQGNPVKGIDRHPIVEDDVVVYAHATILGRITVGRGSIIGGNVWVTNSVEPNSRIVQPKVRQSTFIDGGGI